MPKPMQDFNNEGYIWVANVPQDKIQISENFIKCADRNITYINAITGRPAGWDDDCYDLNGPRSVTEHICAGFIGIYLPNL